jgi:hypothetical protein
MKRREFIDFSFPTKAASVGGLLPVNPHEGCDIICVSHSEMRSVQDARPGRNGRKPFGHCRKLPPGEIRHGILIEIGGFRARLMALQSEAERLQTSK